MHLILVKKLQTMVTSLTGYIGRGVAHMILWEIVPHAEVCCKISAKNLTVHMEGGGGWGFSEIHT